MAYFSNGTEGRSYEEKYCERCIHNEGCTVWLAHLLRNYEECNNEKSILHILIPRSADDRSNQQCTMFLDETLLSPLAREKFKSSQPAPT
jgi:hypothetical protein